MDDIRLVNVFTHQGQGGNPCPIAIDAAGWADEDMQAVARRFGHEVRLRAAGIQRRFRLHVPFLGPRHEMEMCRHATIGASGTWPGPAGSPSIRFASRRAAAR